MATFTPTGQGSLKKTTGTSPKTTQSTGTGTAKSTGTTRKVGSSTFTPTKYAGIRTSTLRKWQYDSNDAASLINNYITRINNGEYLSSDELTAYGNAVKTYESTSESLRSFAKRNGTTYTDKEDKDWADTISSLKQASANASEFYGQFANKKEYNAWSKWMKSEEERNSYITSAINAPDYEEYRKKGDSVSRTFDIKNTMLDTGDIAEVREWDTMMKKYMTDDEYGAYRYYLGKGDFDTAEKYESYFDGILQQRAAEKYIAAYDNTAAELLLSLSGGIDQGLSGIKNAGSAIWKTAPHKASTEQYIVSGLQQNNKGAWKVFNDLATTTGNMLPSIAVGALGGGVLGNITMGLSAGGNAYKELIDAGYSADQARTYGVLTGLSETLMETVIGGIGKLGAKVAPKLVEKLTSGITDGALRTITQIGGKMLSEGVEESVQEVIEPLLFLAATGDADNFEWSDWSDVAYAGFLGALSAGFLDGVPSVANAVSTSINTKRAYSNTDIGTIIDTALEINPDNKLAQSMKSRLGSEKNVSSLNLSELINQSDRAKISTAVQNRLTELGETGNVDRIAEAITKKQLGEELTLSEKNALRKSEYSDRVLNSLDRENILSGQYDTAWAEQIGTMRYNADVYNLREAAPDVSTTQDANFAANSGENGVTPTNTPENVQNANSGQINANAAVRTNPYTVDIARNGKVDTSEIASIESVSGDIATVTLANGEKISSSEISFSDAGAELVFKTAVERVGRVDKFTSEAANAMIKAYSGTDGEYSTSEFISGWTQAYDIGAKGGSISQVNVSPYSSKLPSTLRTTAYNIGRSISQASGTSQGTATAQGKLTYAQGVDPEILTDRQRSDIKALRTVAEALGVNIEIFESQIGEDGVRAGDNGSYDSDTKTLRVDLHSGTSGEGAMLYVASHELTHFIRDISQDGFNTFADAVVELFEARGVDVDALVEAKLEEISMTEQGEGLSESELYDLAYEEMIADAAESMLTDSDALERLSQTIKKTDKSLWQKIRDYFADLVKKIKATYAKLSPSSMEGSMVKDMQESATNLYKTWSDAVVDIASNRRTVGERTQTATSADGEVKRSARTDNGFSNRELLARALESTVQSEQEMVLLDEYTANIKSITVEEQRLTELKAELNRTADAQKKAKIRSEMVQVSERINIYDKMLLDLESTSVLRDVLRREKAKSYKEAASRGREAMKKNSENRKKAEYRRQIQKTAQELSNLLDKGNKKKNVKDGERGIVRAALDVANVYLATDEDLIMGGIETETSAKEASALDLYRSLNEKYHATDGDISGHLDERKTLRSQMWEAKRDLKELLERERKRIAKANVHDSISKLEAEYSKLSEASEEHLRLAYKPEVHDFLKGIENQIGTDTIVSEMTVNQLKLLKDAYTMVKHMVQESNKLFRNGRKEALTERVDAVFGEIGALADNKYGKDMNENLAKVMQVVNDFGWNNLRPVDAFELMGSEHLSELFWDAAYAQDAYVKVVQETGDALVKAREKFHYSTWDIDAVHTFKDSTGKEFTLTLGEMMSIYAYSRRPQADKHLSVGGIQYAKGSSYKTDHGIYRRRSGKSETHLIGDLARMDIIKSLTADQINYVNEIQGILTDLGKRGNEISKILYGIDLFGEEHYFPLKSARDFMPSAQTALGDTVTTASLSNSGFTRSTVPEASNPIVLQAFDEVLCDHVDRMAKYYAYVIPIENLRKILDSRRVAQSGAFVSVKTLISEKLGSGAQKYLENYITDLNGAHSGSGATSPTSRLFSKAKGASVAANLSVWIQQYFSIGRAASVVDPKYFIPFLGESYRDGSATKVYDELCRYAPVAVLKEMGGFDIGNNRGFADYYGFEQTGKSPKKTEKKMRDRFGIGAEAMDKLGWSTIWRAVKKEVAATGDYKTGSTEYFNACGKRFTEVVTRTQVYDSVNTRSGNMRSKSELMQFATAFMGEPTVIAGNLVTQFTLYKRALGSGDKAQIKAQGGKFAMTLATTAISTAMTSIAKALVYAGRDDDEDESFLEKYAYALAGSLRDDINPMGYIPLLRDLKSILDGWSVERPDMDLLEDLVNSSTKFLKNLSNGVELDTLDGVREFGENAFSLAGSIANLFGLPLKNIIRDVGAIINTIFTLRRNYKSDVPTSFESGWKDGDSLMGSVIRGKLSDIDALSWAKAPDDSKSALIYSAVMRGDEGRLEYYRSTYADESGYRSALVRALRVGDVRVGQAAQAMLDGDAETYYAYLKEVVAEGYFEADVVIDAFLTEYKSRRQSLE